MIKLIAVIGLSLCLYVPEALAAVEVGENLSLYGDLRARYEQDERTAAGVKEERDRMRYRLRFGFNHRVMENVTIGGRLATGGANAGSPHSEFGGTSGFEKDEFMVDKVFVKGSCKQGGWAWFGKNSVPLWKQNDYFFDSDINPEGLALGYELKKLGPVDLIFQGGTFVVDEGSWSTGDDQDITLDVYQAAVKTVLEPVDIAFAYGVVQTDANAVVRNASATTIKGDFSLASLQVKVKALPLAVTLGYDLMKSDASAEESGNVITFKLGIDKFVLAAILIDIEANAVSPFAQDDFISLYSGFEGTQLQLQYNVSENMNLNFRRFDGELDNSTYEETRNRLDLNIKF